MNNDLISVIVPCYNVEKYLEKCVESILNQTYQNLEIILVDDGSTDSTPTLCDKLALADTRIKVFHKVNEGVSIARNTGIENSIGKYVTFLDSDDWIEPDTIKIAYEKIKKDDLDLVVWGYTADFVNENEQVLNSREYKAEGVCERGNASILTQKDTLGLSGYVWNKIYKTDIIKDNNLNFKLDISLYEDLLFNSQYYLLCKKIGFLDYTGNHYIQRRQVSLGTKRYENIFELKLRGCAARENILEYFGLDKKSVVKVMSSFYYSALKSAIFNIKTDPNLLKKEKIRKIKVFINDKKVQDIAKKAMKASLKQRIFVIAVRMRLASVLSKF